jgi:hypothetical protein
MGLSILFAILFFFLGFIYQKMETDAVYIDDIDFFEEDEDDDLVDELTEEVEEALE